MSVAALVHRGDLDELVRAVDAAATRGDVDEVVALRRGCLDAVEFSGRQLWGPAAYAAYRLALDAPVELAVEAFLDADDRHMLGPLTEVVAQRHDWAALGDHLPPGPISGTVAVERVVRGEDLADDPAAAVHHLDVPGTWLDWEGPRPRVDYRSGEVLAPAPVARPTGPAVTATAPGDPIDDPELVQAWEALVAPWATSATGSVAVAVADGPVTGAVGAVVSGSVARTGDTIAPADPVTVELEPITLADAVAALGWSAASGGAARRRRGCAAGRSAAWWALRVLVGHEPGSDVDDLREDLGEWTWWRFGPVEEDGWWLRLAGQHVDGWSLAIDARDPPPEDLVLDVPPDADPDADPTGDDPAPTDPWADFDQVLRGLDGQG